MKKTFLMLSVALLAMTSMSVSNTYAAEDFDALLNALNDNTATTGTATPAETPASTEKAPAETPVVTTTAAPSAEMDLDSMKANETAVQPTSEVSQPEASLTTEPLVEPTTNSAETWFLDNVLGSTNYSNESNVSGTWTNMLETEPTNSTTVTGNNTAGTGEFTGESKLTATGLEDSIYVLALLSIIAWVAFVRRKKSA